MKKKFLRIGFVTLCLLTAGISLAQYWGGHEGPPVGKPRTAREVPSHSTGTPNWTNQAGLDKDVFTFVRIKYSRSPNAWRSAGYWWTDFPDSDLNLSYRLQQLTSIKVDPDGRVLELTDKELFDYPWIYMVEPGGLELTDEEVPILRRYLLNGGFLMVDDFWGEREWNNFYHEIKKVFPDREPVELPLDHPLYHCVFDIKSKGQVPNVYLGVQSQYSGVTWERPDAKEVHHRAIFDDKGRMMVMATHNTDNGDGWEREGEDDYYFHTFSENISYPLGINIIFYVMTH